MSVRATATQMTSTAAAAADAESGVQVATVSADHQTVKPKSATPVTLSSEVVPGIFLDRAGCRKYMRDKLQEYGHLAAVSDVKPQKHDRYCLFTGMCLRCKDANHAVAFKGTYYRQDVGVSAKMFVITESGAHEHDELNSADWGRVFEPNVEKLAQEYVATTANRSLKGLQNYLVTHGVEVARLPPNARMSRWLLNHKPKNASAADTSTPPMAELLKRSLEEWPDAETQKAAELFLINDPPRMHDRSRVCVPFACKGMLDSMRRYADTEIALTVDAKQSCMAHGWGVITASIIVKDKLRYTTLGRIQGRRVQGQAFTSHAAPSCQAVINVENHENVHQFFETLKRLWSVACPGRPPLPHCVVQVHKDYHASIEAARVMHFTMSRPANDFFHLMQKRPTIAAKLANTEMQGGVYVKTELGWVIASLEGMRHLPTIDLWSALWGGWLRRCRFKGETVLADYLGPEGTDWYTSRITASNLRSMGKITCHAPSGLDELLFSPHWAGIMGIIPGTDCGDQPQEAFHSPWKKQLETMGKNATATQVFFAMQTLYDIWSQQCDWSNHNPLQLIAPVFDQEHLHGKLLNLVGRSTAVDFHNAMIDYEIVDISAYIQVVAMQSRVGAIFDRLAAQRGARMLFLGGPELLQALREATLLRDLTHDNGDVAPNCTFLSEVLKFFVNTVYVLVREPGHEPHPSIPQPICTCTSCCRYGGCEHIEFIKMLDLRLRKATTTTDTMPELKRRGRKRGSTLTNRSAARPKVKAPKR